MKRSIRIAGIILLLLAVFLLALFSYHNVMLEQERPLREPTGELEEVDGHHMCVSTEGSGDTTLVFMAGSGTSSPIYDFKSLGSLLSDEYRVTVVEKFGYGFSDVVDRKRDVDTMLEDTRAALAAAGLKAPYVLCPHSMSALEAIYWAQKYPDEVEAIVGLDPAVPEYYNDPRVTNLGMVRLAYIGSKLGIIRLIPGLDESEAMKHGTLTEEEKEICRAVFYARTLTRTMLNESEAAEENARKVDEGGVPQVPMIFFTSDGSDSAMGKEEWRRIQKDYIDKVPQGRQVLLDCPHYVHDYEYDRISREIKEFLKHERDHN
ncbi:alpha/beta hydrolase [Ruminococcus sp.]|uniref:alpha/beta hydrolase n=1 Tax=Ruminococcus sp. TaxID=41978 RepID=UPI0025E0021C|nr:alpha/beta hydrolase [Ruminococcus sp.]